MAFLTSASRLFASAVLLCSSSVLAADTLSDLQQQLDALRKQDTYKVNPGSLSIESWLLTATAVDATADKIHEAVAKDIGEDRVLVVAPTEPLDFGKAVMFKTEIEALGRAIHQECGCAAAQSLAPIALAGALAGMLKTETELTGISQTVDAKLLAAAVAGKFSKGIIPSAAVTADNDGPLMRSFKELMQLADAAKNQRDVWAKGSDEEKKKAERLSKVLDRYDAFYARVTSSDANGNVPLVAAAKLDELLGDNVHILRVNTEQAGGTLVKRTNLFTALGAESAFVTGGLVSSYQLADPKTGQMIKAGIVSCRTALTSLKRVQEGSWNAPAYRTYDRSRVPAALCTTIPFAPPSKS